MFQEFLVVVFVSGWLVQPGESGIFKKTKEKIKDELDTIKKPHDGEQAPNDAVYSLMDDYWKEIKVRSKFNIETSEDAEEMKKAHVDPIGWFMVADGPDDNYYIRVITGDAIISHVKISTVRGEWVPKPRKATKVGSLFSKMFNKARPVQEAKHSTLKSVKGNKADTDSIDRAELDAPH